MKIDDLITEAPMGILKHAASKLKSYVPGSSGARAQGELDVGRVANQWKKDYANYLGQMGSSGFGSTRTFVGFLRYLGFTDAQVRQVLKGGGIQEAKQIYEAMITSRMIDTLMMRAARVAAASRYGSKQNLPKEPNPTAPRQPGMIDKAVDIGKAVGKTVAPYAKDVGQHLGQKATDLAKGYIDKKLGAAPKQRVEPTMGQPVPRDMSNIFNKQPQQPQWRPSKKAPKMRMKPVTKYK